MKENARRVKLSLVVEEINPTGVEKGRGFKRKSKGQITREARRYQQDLRTGVLKSVK